MDSGAIEKYFSGLHPVQRQQFQSLGALYADWNLKINVVSRKDVLHLYERHVLHSLAIAKFIRFVPGSRIIDVGTGGGFPGIPLAILFPHVRFTLLDSIGKKIKVVEEVVYNLGLSNVETAHMRAEDHRGEYDFIISRAVARMDTFVRWTKHLIRRDVRHSIPNGIIYLKGGNLEEELSVFPEKEIIPLNLYFEEAFFETKKLVYLPLQ